jgi:D-alanine transaminase
MSRIVYVNGEYLPEEEAKISVFDRGFLFSDGIYEVSAVMGGRLIDNGAHLARLWRSLDEIELAMPWSDEGLLAIQHELIARNTIDEGLVYIQVTRGAQVSDGHLTRDFPFPKDTHPTLMMFAKPLNMTSSPQAMSGIKVITVPDIRWKRCDIKSVALLAQVLAKQAAAAAGAQEAWMLDGDVITEGGSSTAWIVNTKGQLVTRPLSNAVLPGITRQAVLKLMAETGLTLDERAFDLDEAFAAKEAFITAASSLVMPVVSIDGRTIGDGKPGPLATRLRAIYISVARLGGRLG